MSLHPILPGWPTPRPRDVEQTRVIVDLRDPVRNMTIACECVVSHYGTAVVSVAFPDGWAGLVRLVGHDPYDTAVEGWLETEAKMAFRRMEGR